MNVMKVKKVGLTFITCNTCNTFNTFTQRGFTFIELIVSIAILLIIFTIITINISPLPSNTLVATTGDTLITDIKSQQTLAMSNNSRYGVHFGANSYTLFSGNSYAEGLTDNFVVNLDEGIGFANLTWPNSEIIFEAGSGEVVGHTQGLDSFTIQSTQTGRQKEIRINKYGATY